jgi:hypothetical protein
MRLKTISRLTGAALLSFGLPVVSAYATETLVTSPNGFSWPVIDLSAFANGSYNFTNGPVSLPNGIAFTASPGVGGDGVTPNGNSGQGSVIGQGEYGLLNNGGFGGNATYIGVDSGTGFDTLIFDSPVATFGAYWNYATPVDYRPWWTNPTISTFDSGGNLIDSFDLSVLAPISTPGGFNEFLFRGIVDTSAQIKYVEFGGAYMLLAQSATGSVIPEPSTWAMMILGFACLGFAGYRSARRSVSALA